MTATHTHDDSRTLTWGCPACVERVRRDQEAARWRDAPVRRCTWSFRCAGEWHQFVVDQRVPLGAERWQVNNHYDGFGLTEARALVVAKGFDADHWQSAILRTLGCHTIGPVVEDVAAAPAIDQPSLFGVS